MAHRDEFELVLTLLAVIPVWPDLKAQLIRDYSAAFQKWVRFIWKCVEYKEQIGFAFAIFL